MSIESVTYREILDADELAVACERWRLAPALALDTEFARERTFYPALGLIQISDGRENVLVDPLVIDDLGPLADLLTEPRVVKVLHSCSEDLEVLHHRLGVVPTPIFDTQIAAAMAGLDYSMGYARLVGSLCDVDLPKGHTRSNWIQRPLSDAQKRYAALDVEYLLDCWEQIWARLDRLDRASWLEEDCARLTDPERFRVDDQAYYRKFARGRRLRPRQLVVLYRLVLWREQQARDRDLPRGFVLKDAALHALALRRPSSPEELESIRELDRRDRQRHGKTLLRLIAEARSASPSEQPEPIPPPMDLRPYKDLVQALKKETKKAARALDVPVEILASRRQIEALLRRRLAGEPSPLPRSLEGWRREAVGEALLRLLEEKLPSGS